MTPSKAELRAALWQALIDSGDARFPGTKGRIPNFVGAEAAADHLRQRPEWIAATRIKCNPDSPQRPVRHRALLDGKIVIFPAPKLAEDKPFLLLDPSTMSRSDKWKASAITGAFEFGRPVTPEEVGRLDLIITGCVGVTPEGARLGKGGGYSDLEYALLHEVDLVDENTPIFTTVHHVQVAEEGSLPMMPHDISLDGYATPSGWVTCPRPFVRPTGIQWDILSEDKEAAIPALISKRREAATKDRG